MTGKSPTEITFFPDGVDANTGRELQDAVSRTILSTFESGMINYPWKTPFPAGPSVGNPSTSITAGPTTSPTPVPSTGPTPVLASPTASPTAKLTVVPTSKPTAVPTAKPTEGPTAKATVVPTAPPTARPSSPSPDTARPTALRPVTPNPTPDVPEQESGGSITVSFQMDNFPQDISWTMIEARNNEGETLFFQAYGDVTTPGALITKTFNNLEVGRTYLFKAKDEKGDGVCCDHGFGSLEITDNVRGRTLFRSSIYFKTFLALDFSIASDGEVHISDLTNLYQPASWKEFENMVASEVEDGSWPGKMPSTPTFSMMVNVKADASPEDISFSLFRARGLRWVEVNSWDGTSALAEPGVMESIEFSNLEQGWYRFLVEDKQENGLCCEEGSGFVSLTGPVMSTDGAMGIIWGNDGEYLGKDEVYFRVDRTGFISHISFVPVAYRGSLQKRSRSKSIAKHLIEGED